MTNNGFTVSSREWQIDCEIRRLIGKMVRGEITPDDHLNLNALIRERSDRMMPSLLRARR